MSSTHLPTVIILGGSYAGLMACARVLHSKRRARIIVIDAKNHFEQKIRLHETAVGRDTATLSLPHVLKRRGVEFIQATIDRVDLQQNHVCLHDGQTLSYDYLIYALGSVPSQPIQGSHDFAWSLDQRSHVQQQHSRIAELARHGKRIVVLGGGLTALELSHELASTYPTLQVALVCKHVGQPSYSLQAQQYLIERCQQQAIAVHQQAIVAVHVQHVELANGEHIAFDLCFDCCGLRANPVAAQSGLSVNALGQLPVDSFLRLRGSNHVFVAGDAAYLADSIRMSCATAMPMGAHAGSNVAALLDQKPLQSFSFAYLAQFISLGRQHALVQFVDAYDQATTKIRTGFLAIRYKEWICQMTITLIKWELVTGLKWYRWLHQPVDYAPHRAPESV